MSYTASSPQRLRRHLGLREVPLDIIDPVQQLARIHQDVIDTLRVDVRAVDPSPPRSAPLATPVVEADGARSFTDEWGITWGTPAGGGLYFDSTNSAAGDGIFVARLKP